MRKSCLILLVITAGCTSRNDQHLPPAAKSGAAALTTADQTIGPRATTIAAIDDARRFVAENVAQADAVGYRARCCRVRDGHAETYLDQSQGPLESTNRRLDLGINGSGFFRVKIDPNVGDGFAYTRSGHLFLNPEGNIVLGSGDGYRIDPPITVPRDAVDISISEDGIVNVQRSGDTRAQVVGQFRLYQFTSPASLQAIDATLYQQTQASGGALESRPKENAAGQLEQSFLEKSNVNLTREKLRMEFLDRWRTQVLDTLKTP